MATDAVKSQSILNSDSQPVVPNSSAQGGPGRKIVVDDFCVTSATGLQSVGSYYKLVRIPSGAIVKSVKIWSDKQLDSIASAPTLALDFNLIFSDASGPMDGTPSFLQGLIPQTGTAATTTTIATYSSPNIIYGNLAVSTTGVLKGGIGGGGSQGFGPVEIVLNGSRTNYPLTSIMPEPLWQIFNFLDGRSNLADPGGFFDLMAYVSTVAATGVVAVIYAQVEYVI